MSSSPPVDVSSLLAQPPSSVVPPLDLSVLPSHMSALLSHELECERDGDYVSAELCRQRVCEYKALEAQRKHEAIVERQRQERNEVEQCEMEELNEFNAIWDRKLADFDRETSLKLAGLFERHVTTLAAWTQQQQEKMLTKPKYSKTLLDLRAVQESLAKAKKYAAAQKLQAQADQRQAAELEAMKAEWLDKVLVKKDRILKQQAAEVDAIQLRRAGDRELLLKQRVALVDSTIIQKFRNLKCELTRQQNKEIQASVKKETQSENIQKLKQEMNNIPVPDIPDLPRPRTAAMKANPYSSSAIRPSSLVVYNPMARGNTQHGNGAGSTHSKTQTLILHQPASPLSSRTRPPASHTPRTRPLASTMMAPKALPAPNSARTHTATATARATAAGQEKNGNGNGNGYGHGHGQDQDKGAGPRLPATLRAKQLPTITQQINKQNIHPNTMERIRIN